MVSEEQALNCGEYLAFNVLAQGLLATATFMDRHTS